MTIRQDNKEPDISFGPADLRNLVQPHSDALVFSVEVANCTIHRIFVDTGSAVNIIYMDCLTAMDLNAALKPSGAPLYGFTGKSITPVGSIELPMTWGQAGASRTRILHFLREEKYGRCVENQIISKKCHVRSLTSRATRKRSHNEIDYTRASITRVVNPRAENIIERAEVEGFKKNPDKQPMISTSDHYLEGIDRALAEHRLNVNPAIKPVVQQTRHFGPEKDAAIREQIQTLLKAGHTVEFHYPIWLSNAIMFEKKEKIWRMCVDYRYLNVACPKDCYPLPRIDQLVDSTAGYELLSMMDAFQGYHQISMHPTDISKTAFVSYCGVFGWARMPFGLKNTGATYQRMMDTIFEGQIGRIMSVYVDDMMVQSKGLTSYPRDLDEVFDVIRRNILMLNPNKCTFRLSSYSSGDRSEQRQNPGNHGHDTPEKH
ncbi:uncharacterized protein LOC130993976 [Salvia miltiorrhiza]|uniref:uncharacterized protein LOC130993976 n=1 Tax=Salvia miltiorrhiza TaxID=226208 RepID=UPI0025AC4199|nr:uncharacterized protein LOC130993976 [Salvia miltiorrhiza]